MKCHSAPRLGAFLLGLAALLTLASGPVRAADEPEARIIVKFKADSSLKQAQAGSRIQALGERLGLAAQLAGHVGPDVQVMRASGLDSAALAARVARQSDVEYAVPDRVKTVRALPNDPLYPNQWYLHAASATQPAATNAEAAWDLSAGSASVIVAVLDTGVRFDHEDLSSRLVPGYDFVLDDPNSADGQIGRDADASDPGDYLTTADLLGSASLRSMCGSTPTHSSSWHGTQVAGIIAAQANNSRGIAGIAGNTRILPLRVLGKCGGYDSDIVAAMRWAAGLSVPGLPANPNPAKVINLSLGGSGTCSAAYASAVAEVRTAGVLVVAAAGNETSPVEEPANCAGVLAVAGIRHAGTKVGYSSYGAQVGISAPAGNCVNTTTGSPCLFPFVNTINLGSTVPTTNGYSNLTSAYVGTSFATPLVAGTAALMRAANPALGESELTLRIKRSATAFPSDPSLPTCPSVTSDGQCNCTTVTCGAGMLNTLAAVQAALEPSAVIAVQGTPTAGQALSLSAASSAAVSPASLTSWSWSQVGGSVSGSFSDTANATTTFTAPSAGDYVIRLTVTDSLGRSASVDQTLTVQAAASSSGGTSSGGKSGGGGGAFDPLSAAVLLIATLFTLHRRRQEKSSPTERR